LVEGLKKPNTLRKYKAVLNRFSEFFLNKASAQSITADDLNDFMVHLKKTHELDNNTVIHNVVIVAQFLKKNGRGGITRQIDLPEKITALPQGYGDTELKKYFYACTAAEYTLFLTVLLTRFREQEVLHLRSAD